MKERIPYFLHEAVLSVYPAGADGQAVVAAPVWSGALATGLRASLEYDEVKVQGAGSRFTVAHHVDEEHVLEVDRTWLIRRAAPVDFVPGRNQQYVLELVWFSPEEGTWYQRQYFGVTARRVSWQSAGTNQFGTQQIWRAQRFVDNGGAKAVTGYSIYVGGTRPPGLGGGPYTPLPVTAEARVVPFFRENPLIVGDYLLGQYRWPVDVVLGRVEATAWASQGEDTVLSLEIDGETVTEEMVQSVESDAEPTVDSAGVTADDTVVTSDNQRLTPQVVLPAGVANTEVTGYADVGGLLVRAGSGVRWKVLSGPEPSAAAWACAVTMGVAVP